MSDKRLTDILVQDSYRELLWLLKWFSHFGPIPIIIGGWAVYFYNSYFGSMDIDIVGPSHRGELMDIIERYERTHDYQFVSEDMLGLEVTSRKPVLKDGNVIGYMEIDACSFEDPKPAIFHENPDKKLPYSLTSKAHFQRRVELEEGAVCLVPCKPLLLLYKIKAARDRSYDIRTRGTVMGTAQLERLRGKVTKDRADILALVDPNPRRFIIREEFDADAFHNLVRELELQFVLTTITELPKHQDSISLYDPTLKEKQINEWIKSIMK